jgi:membrane-bound metal-dependent hydrolase YbcI (DUF457 family)
MIAAVIADIFLIVFSWILPKFVGGIPMEDAMNTLTVCTHSLIIIVIFLPLLIIGRDYFISAAIGIYSHIFVDIFTHNGFPHLLYPASNAYLPFFVVDDFNPAFVIGCHVIFVIFILFFDWENIKLFASKLKQKVHFFWLYSISVVMLISVISAVYVGMIMDIPVPYAFLIAMSLVAFNTTMILVLFIKECSGDVWVNKISRKVLGKVIH